MEVGTSVVVQEFRLSTYIAEGVGLIPGQGTNMLHAMWYGQNVK